MIITERMKVYPIYIEKMKEIVEIEKNEILKIAGGFRNLKNSKYYCSAISIIDTCKKQNMNIGETIKSIFMGKKKIFAF